MLSQTLRVASRRGLQLSHRSLSTTASSRSSEVSVESRDKWYPKTGDRDIVGFGFNGAPLYMDREEFPAPAIRFKSNTPEILALREKEKGDWKTLSIEDKKSLYRASFCQTYAEMKAPTGEWKSITAGIIFGLALTGWAMIWLKQFVYPKLPSTVTKEWQIEEVKRMVTLRQGAIEGVSSKYDYENQKWK